MSGLFDVTGKRVLVTGGSRGIGLMIARGFVDAGAEVVISSRSAEACTAVASELGCTAFPADLGTAEGRAALVDAVGTTWDSLDVLVNNAGATWGEPLATYPEKAFDKLWGINVKSVFELTQELLPMLRAAVKDGDPARVINVGSVDGIKVPALETYAYSSTKSAVHMLTRHLARVLASENITVNAVAPGPFDSKMMAFALDDPGARAAIAGSIPLGRIGQPSDMAGVTIFLSSLAGSYLTGTVIPVDGGHTA